MNCMKYIVRGLVLLTLTTAGALGCSPDINAYCADMVDCETGNEYDEDACVDGLKAARDVADAYGCKAQFDEMSTCAADHGTCESTGLSSSDSGYPAEKNYVIGEACSAVADDYSTCMNEADAVFGW